MQNAKMSGLFWWKIQNNGDCKGYLVLDNIKINLRGIVWSFAEWIHLA
jgi:hypothetical protein